MGKSASVLRRMRRQNVDPIYGNKFRKGNKGTKLEKLQIITLQNDYENMVDNNGNAITFRNHCKMRKTKTIYHWKNDEQ